MKITADTNVLVRALVQDDARQGRAAAKALGAEQVVVPLPVLCELVWVLRRVYGFSMMDIASAIRALLAAANVVTDRLAAEAGLALVEAGGDFADGVIAWRGQWLGADTFVTFDRKARTLLARQGVAVQSPEQLAQGL